MKPKNTDISFEAKLPDFKDQIYKELGSLRQVIPDDMMKALRSSALEKGHTLDFEISLRLLSTIILNTASYSDLATRILGYEFSLEDIKKEKMLREHGALYEYEYIKLKTFLLFKPRLPKNLKEEFLLMGKEELDTIRKEIEEEKKAENKAKKNRGSDGFPKGKK